MGIFGVSVATYALPTLSALYAEGKLDNFKQVLDDALRLLWFVTIPAAVGLIILAEPIIRLLFERGKFDATATDHAAFALVFLAPGLVSYATVNVLARAFYAMQDPMTPMKLGVMSMVVNVFLAFALMWPLREGGLALANTLSSTMNALALLVALRQRVGGIQLRPLCVSFVRTTVASALMGGACWWTLSWLRTEGFPLGMGARLQESLIPVFVGLVVFVVVARLLAAPELRDVMNALRRRRRKS